MTNNDIYRTAFKKIINSGFVSQYGYKNPNMDKNEICPYCYNENTDVVKDSVVLNNFHDFYRDRVKSFKVLSCYCCKATFSLYEPNSQRSDAPE